MTARTEDGDVRKRSGFRGCCMGCFTAFAVAVAFVVAWCVFQARQPLGFQITTPVVPKSNGYDDIVRAARMCATLRNRGPLNAMPATMPKLEPGLAAAVAAESRPVVALVRIGLRKDCMCPPLRTMSQVTNGHMGDYTAIRDLARVLVGTAKHYEFTAKYGAAASILLDANEVGVATSRGGGFIDMLVGAAVEAIATRDIERVIPRLPASDLDRAAARLDRIAARRSPLPDVFIEEMNRLTVMALPTLRALRPVGPLASLVPQWNIAGAIRQERARFIAFAQECRLPFTGKSNVGQPYPAWPGLSANDLVKMRAKYETMTAVLAILRTETALYRYRAEHTRFPGSLTELVPAELARVPDDPFGGKAGVPLRYRPAQGGSAFLLYSVGPDMRDDGGSPLRFDRGSTGDLVAGHLVGKRKSAANPATPDLPLP
jgi:hypothetical protein